MPWPGFEPGLLRPQRNVLTTIRSRLPLLLTCTANFQTDKAYASWQKYLLPYTFILAGSYIFHWLLTPLFFQWYFSASVILFEDGGTCWVAANHILYIRNLAPITSTRFQLTKRVDVIGQLSATCNNNTSSAVFSNFRDRDIKSRTKSARSIEKS